MSRFATHSSLVLASALLLGCSGGEPDAAVTAGHVVGDCADAYGAELCTWAHLESGAVVAVGATVPLASIEGAPAEQPMTWPPAMTAAVDFPANAGGVTHVTMYWEPMGHTPPTFMTPHFDFHFYVVPASDRLAIDCVNEAKAAALPEGYGLPDEVLPPEQVELTGEEVLVGLCVPQMGMHSVHLGEASSEELFEGTMIVGYYEERLIFIEPMISQALLLRRESFDLAIPEIPGRTGGPTTFQAIYDADTDAYQFELSGFTQAE